MLPSHWRSRKYSLDVTGNQISFDLASVANASPTHFRSTTPPLGSGSESSGGSGGNRAGGAGAARSIFGGRASQSTRLHPSHNPSLLNPEPCTSDLPGLPELPFLKEASEQWAAAARGNQPDRRWTVDGRGQLPGNDWDGFYKGGEGGMGEIVTGQFTPESGTPRMRQEGGRKLLRPPGGADSSPG